MDSILIKNPLGYWEIRDKPTLQELQQYYAEKYYQEAKGSYELEYTPEERQYFRAKLEQRWTVIKRLKGNGRGSLLDVGCGEGFNLAFFRELGWSVKGLDFSSAGVESKNPDCIDALATGDVYLLLDAEISEGRTYDVVWLQNVLEHVIEPLELLEKLRALVSPSGIAVVTVPNDFSITQLEAMRHQYVHTDFWVAPPDHLNYFSPDSLRNVAKATGWECQEILGDLPLDWFLFHPGSNYIRDKRLGKTAHRARVQLENLIHQQPAEDVVDFWSALAKIGFGRNITAFMRPTLK